MIKPVLTGRRLAAGRGWQAHPDLCREAGETPVPGEFLQAALDQPAGTVQVTPQTGQPRLQEGALGTPECRVADDPVEAVLGF